MSPAGLKQPLCFCSDASSSLVLDKDPTTATLMITLAKVLIWSLEAQVRVAARGQSPGYGKTTYTWTATLGIRALVA